MEKFIYKEIDYKLRWCCEDNIQKQSYYDFCSEIKRFRINKQRLMDDYPFWYVKTYLAKVFGINDRKIIMYLKRFLKNEIYKRY